MAADACGQFIAPGEEIPQEPSGNLLGADRQARPPLPDESPVDALLAELTWLLRYCDAGGI